MLDLVTDGSPRPTAKEIAERAGVSLRSVYVHFDDLEDLFCVAAKRHYRPGRADAGADLGPQVRCDKGRPRLSATASSCTPRSGRSPAPPNCKRRSRRHSPRSFATRRRVRGTEIERLFDAELVAMPERERKRSAGIIDVMTSSHAWETLTESHGLPVADALESNGGSDPPRARVGLVTRSLPEPIRAPVLAALPLLLMVAFVKVFWSTVPAEIYLVGTIQGLLVALVSLGFVIVYRAKPDRELRSGRPRRRDRRGCVLPGAAANAGGGVRRRRCRLAGAGRGRPLRPLVPVGGRCTAAPAVAGARRR